MVKKYDLIILGGGPAGLAAAMYASRFRLKTIVFSASPGGMIVNAHLVENYPGFESISGAELMTKFESHAKKFGAEILYEEAVNIEKTKEGYSVESGSNEHYDAPFVLIASGTQRKKLNIPGEEDLLGRGVSYCATCDAAFFKDKTVAVVGGNDSALHAAEILADNAKKVYLIYRGEAFRAEPVRTKNVLANKKVVPMYATNVVEAIGVDNLEKIRLDNGKELAVEGLFIEIGSVPATSLAKKLGVLLDEANNIKVDEAQKTNIEGIYAAGDITNGSNKFRQVISAAAEGSIAASAIYSEHKKRFGAKTDAPTY